MSEYVKTCPLCEGKREIDYFVSHKEDYKTEACCWCNGTGQQLVKPIPEGAVVVTAEDLMGMLNDGCPPSLGESLCPYVGIDSRGCHDCWREWLTNG